MFPSYYVPESESKQKEWSQLWAAAICGVNNGSSMNMEDYKRMQNNWNAVHGKINSSEFEYITKLYGIRTPARVVGYPILYNMVERHVGELDEVDISVESVSQEIIDRKLERKVQAAVEMLITPIKKAIGAQTSIDLMEDQAMEGAVPRTIMEFEEQDFHDLVEEGMMNIMRYLILQYNLDEVFKDSFRHQLVTRQPVIHVGIRNDDPFPRVIDPSRVDFGKSSNTKYIQDCAWIRERDEMVLAEFINEFGHMMDKKKYDDLVNFSGTEGTLDKLPSQYRGSIFQSENGNAPIVRLWRYEWKAVRMLNVKQSENPYDPQRPYIKLVDRKAKATSTYPFIDIWQGVSFLGEHHCWRKPNQTRDIENIADANLSYFGLVNPGPSLVDRGYNLFLFHVVVMYHIEATLNRAGGKAVVYDVAQKPEKQKTSDIFYNAKEGGIILINTATDKAMRSRNFNQFQQIDFTLSETIGQLFHLKEMIEKTLEDVSGMPDTLMARASSEETVANNRDKHSQARMMSATLYDEHYHVVEDVLNECMKLICITWSDEEDRTMHVFGKQGLQIFRLMKESLRYSYGLFIKNTQRDKAKKQFIMEQMASMATAGHSDPLEMLKTFNASSSKEAERILKAGVRAMQKSQAAQAQAQNQLAMQELQIKREANQSRIIAARIEAQAYLETEKMKNDREERMLVKATKGKVIESMAEKQNRLDESMLMADLDEQKVKMEQAAAKQAADQAAQQQKAQEQPAKQQPAVQ